MMKYDELKDDVVGESMMNMQEFYGVQVKIILGLRAYLPDEWKHTAVTVKVKIDPMDGTMSSRIVFMDKNIDIEAGVTMESLYDDYLETKDLDLTLRRVAEALAKRLSKMKEDVRQTRDFELVRDKIVFNLVNTDNCSEMLMNCPHRNILDLSVVYRIVFKEESEIHSMNITNPLTDCWGITEDQLYELALDNMKRICPPFIKTFEELARGILKETYDIFFSPSDEEYGEGMWCCSTGDEMTESALSVPYALVQTEELARLADLIGSNLYVVASSRYEALAFSGTNVLDAEDLVKIVHGMNQEAVAPEDRLSDHVYFYDRASGELSIVA